MPVLWTKPPILQDSFDPIDLSAIRQLEKSARVNLPLSYVTFLLQHNGGYFRQITESGTLDMVAIQAFYAMSPRIDSELSQTIELERQRLGKKYIPVAYSGLNDIILVRNTDASDSEVYAFDGDTHRVSRVSRSFSEFLNGIRYSPAQQELSTETLPPFIQIERGDVQYLSSYSDLLDQKNSSGESPLCCAAGSLQPRVVEFLLQLGADANQVDDRRLSPLMGAASNGGYEICRKLLECGADPSLVDDEGMSAMDWAIAMNAGTRLKDLLQSATKGL